eukprot:7982362-Lingulodinium_polyedra.AAC.1
MGFRRLSAAVVADRGQPLRGPSWRSRKRGTQGAGSRAFSAQTRWVASPRFLGGISSAPSTCR